MKAGMSHEPRKKKMYEHLEERLWKCTLQMTPETGRLKKKKTGKEENRLAAIIAMNEWTCTFGKVINEYEV